MCEENTRYFCYHIRDLKGAKIAGGCLQASSYDDAARRVAAYSDIQVRVKTSHNMSFTKDGEDVYIYLSVHPDMSEKGKAALREFCNQRDIREEQARLQAERDEEEAYELLYEKRRKEKQAGDNNHS